MILQIENQIISNIDLITCQPNLIKSLHTPLTFQFQGSSTQVFMYIFNDTRHRTSNLISCHKFRFDYEKELMCVCVCVCVCVFFKKIMLLLHICCCLHSARKYNMVDTNLMKQYIKRVHVIEINSKFKCHVQRILSYYFKISKIFIKNQ